MAVLIGETRGHLGQSALLAEAFGIEAGDAPPVDLAAERKHGEFIRANRKALARVHATCRTAGWRWRRSRWPKAAGLGVVLTAGDIATLFGEDQARYLVACGPAQGAKLIARAAEAGVPAARVGKFGGTVVRFAADEAPLKALSASYRGAFARAVE